MISGYITHHDYDKLIKLLDDPDIICPSCSNKDDCIGKEECFNRENYKYITIRNDRAKFWGQNPRADSIQGKSQRGVGDSPLSQLDQIDLSLEESDQIQEKENQILGEVD